MLADLLLPFPTSHPSTVPSDLIHPPLRNPPSPILVCSSSFSSFSSLRQLYILHIGLLSILLPSPLVVSPFRLPRQSRDLHLRISSLPRSSSSPILFKPVDLFFSKPLSTRDANDAAILITRYRYFDVLWHRHFRLDWFKSISNFSSVQYVDAKRGL